MNGYLMQSRKLNKGEEIFIESFAPENNFGVVFEDDGETGYFYAIELDIATKEQRILDALHVYELDEDSEKEAIELLIVWAKNWMSCALIINNKCHAIFDFENHGGYNISEFPPPNEIWTKHERKLTNEIIQKLF